VYLIREPRDLTEFAALAAVFQAVFQMPDSAAPPAWLMEDSAKAGGLTLGMWRGEEAVGVSFAFPGVDATGTPYLYSDGLGVLPEHRDRGHAIDMKLAQREHALRRGYGRILWTFSALRSVNAYLYVTRLGATGSEYILDKRGVLDAEWGTEGGVPFDEFLIEWRLDSERVRRRLDGERPEVDLGAVPVLNRCDGEPARRQIEAVLDPPVGAKLVAVEVPPNYQELVDDAPELARKWHEGTRPIFAGLLELGYGLADCLHDRDSDRVHYLFERGQA
jgi:predicted GNAT superfamily acetyltransferase